MKKTLRYSLLLLLTMVSGTMFAENIIWQEDWSSWADKAKTVLDGVNSNYSFTGTTKNEDGSFKSGTTIYAEALAGGEAPELLIAKNGGSFTAKIALNGKSGEMTLTFKSNKALTVTATDATLGEGTKQGNDYTYPVSVAAGKEYITITFTMETNANARFDNAKLFQGEGKKAAGLSWGTSTRTVTLNANDNVFPTLSNENNLPVTYSSSNTEVATIDNSGTITLLAAGTTVISAEFAGNDEYDAAKVTYTLTVKEAAAPAQQISLAEALNIINGLENNATTDQEYILEGYANGLDFQRREDNTLYGNVNFTFVETQGMGVPELTIYRCKYFDNKNFTEETIGNLQEGDAVKIQGKLKKFVKDDVVTPELVSCYLLSINGQTAINTVKTEMNVNAPMYNLAGQRVSKEFKGVVIQNGKKFMNK